MRYLLLALILVVSGCKPALACESYEECMKSADYYQGHGVDGNTYSERERQKAIAYKLDEISKKLDK